MGFGVHARRFLEFERRLAGHWYGRSAAQYIERAGVGELCDRRGPVGGKGFFQDLDAAQAYVDQLEALHQDPSRKDIAWKLGIDEDVMNKDVRQAEVRNWIEKLVIPSKAG